MPPHQSPTQWRIESIQALRAVAAIAVLLFHLRFVEIKYLSGAALLKDFARYADAGVDLFFVVSGFVMATVAARSTSGLASAGRFLRARAWRILPMYWIFTTLTLVLTLLVPAMVNSSYGGQSVVSSYLLLPHEQLPLLAVGWTLIHEAYFYVAFAAALALLPGRSYSRYLIGWAWLVGAGYLLTDDPGSPWRSLTTNPLTLEFIAGALLGLHWRRIPVGWGGLIAAAGITTMALSVFALAWSEVGTPGPLLRALCFGVPALLLVAGAVLLEVNDRLKVPEWMKALGDASYSLYLSHVFVISLVGRAWGQLSLGNGWINHMVFVACAILAACVVGWCVHISIERPLLGLPNRLRRGCQTQTTEAATISSPPKRSSAKTKSATAARGN